ncbi:MAG: hypothetical protein QOD33_565 [Pyrinomonadaceae bacterium]|jgi:hypothetical protein|nr:hypothetical protein [Pyrinomonadaceae bacterium]
MRGCFTNPYAYTNAFADTYSRSVPANTSAVVCEWNATRQLHL